MTAITFDTLKFGRRLTNFNPSLLQAGPLVVTGAAGWLGRGLLRALTVGLPERPDLLPVDPARAIRALILPGTAAELPRNLPGVKPVEGDLCQPESCQRLLEGVQGGTLFHTAGVIHPQRVRDFFAVNVAGTRNLLEAAAKAGMRRAVVVSSNSPCGTNPHLDHRFDETSPYRPYMNYGRSKMLMEQEARRIAAQTGLEVVLIRAPWFYGPDQPPRQTLFFRMIRDGQAPIVGSGKNWRSMAYIDNLCQGLLLAAMVPEAANQTYWIADQRPYTMHEIIDTVERLLEDEFQQTCRHRRMRLPGWLGEVAWLLDWGLQSVGLYQQKIHVLSEMNKTIACHVDKANRELGYLPHVDLEEGMRRSLAWVFARQGGLDQE
ncbi:MAG: NAD(P)-dependent oxidoreductase [Magnetococcus sp. DMHC-1]|nr:NAD(P)-dependent oxidoreductase [Magnetococcales bacterium]